MSVEAGPIGSRALRVRGGEKTCSLCNGLFLKLNAQGQTIFMVTFNQDNAALAHRVINIKDGSLVDDSVIRCHVG